MKPSQNAVQSLSEQGCFDCLLEAAGRAEGGRWKFVGPVYRQVWTEHHEWDVPHTTVTTP